MTLTAESPRPATVLGLPIHLLQDYTGWLSDQLNQGLGVHVVTLNAEMAIEAEKNPALADSIRKGDLIIPDGAGVVLYLKIRGKRIQRCPGIELAESLLQLAPQNGWSALFYGGKPGVTAAAAEEWQRRAPGIAIETYHGYLTPAEEAELLERLERDQPSLIYIGLGVPRQEYWIQEHRHRCPRSIWVGVGGSFDIWSGTKERAPGWLRNNNLEWVYRLYKEPWRWRRMLALPLFAWKAIIGQ
jgi:N-acetylglucosaminyldiphosphoundecaprenol N-acetyl-beta-D-mannosaminyltransferase